MKKILTLLAVLGLLFAPISFAATSKTGGYYSTQHPKVATATTAATKSGSYPYTDITVVNSSYDVIYTIVPGTPIDDRVYPNGNDHIYNDDPNIYWTHLVLLDPYRDWIRPIFDGTVCSRAIVTVYGGPGNYNTYINSNAC